MFVTEDGGPLRSYAAGDRTLAGRGLALSGPLSPPRYLCCQQPAGRRWVPPRCRDRAPGCQSRPNVMFTTTARSLLTDLGSPSTRPNHLDASGMIVGSMDYISPERIRRPGQPGRGGPVLPRRNPLPGSQGVSPFHRDPWPPRSPRSCSRNPPATVPGGLATLIMRLLARTPAAAHDPEARALWPRCPTVARQPATPVQPEQHPRRPETTSAHASRRRRRGDRYRSCRTRRPAPTRVVPSRAFAPPRQPGGGRRGLSPSGRDGGGLGVVRAYQSSRGSAGVLRHLCGLGPGCQCRHRGDCVYHRSRAGTSNRFAAGAVAGYRQLSVLQRVEGTPAECAAAPGWATGDNAAVLPGLPR